jgi:hypothetical protein
VPPQIAHGADISLDALQPVSIAFAIFGALPIHAVTLGHKFAVQSRRHRVVGERSARDGGRQGNRAADRVARIRHAGIKTTGQTGLELDLAQ